MPDINGLGSVSNASYSFGSSDLRLPTTPTNFSAMPSFYDGGLGGSSNLNPSDISFSSSALNSKLSLGAGGGGGSFGTASTNLFARPEIVSLFRNQSAPSNAAGLSSTTPTLAKTINVSSTSPIAPSVFAGTTFKPLTNLYEPFQASGSSGKSSAPKFSFTVIPSLANLSNADWGRQSGTFSRSGLLMSNVPITYAVATGDLTNLFAGTGFRPLQIGGTTAVAQNIANQASAGQPVAYGNYSEGTDFRKWAEAGAKGAVPPGTRNCWEVFLSAAIAQGSLSRDKVAEAYKGGATGIQSLLTNNLQNVNRYDPSLGSKPVVGDLVYFKLTDASGKPFADVQGRADQTPLLAHVAMVTGFDGNGQPVIASHFPKNAETASTPLSAPLELTSISDLSARLGNIGKLEVFVGRPNW
jgi:hypothetical protein